MISDHDDLGEAVWLSKAALAERRGISLASADRLIRRRHWRRQPSNADGKVLVLVPLSALSDDREGQPEGNPGGQGRTALPDDLSDNLGHHPRVLAALETAIAALTEALAASRTDLEREKGRAEVAEARADRAEVRAIAAESRIEAAEARAAHVQAELNQAQIVLSALQQDQNSASAQLADADQEVSRAGRSS